MNLQISCSDGPERSLKLCTDSLFSSKKRKKIGNFLPRKLFLFMHTKTKQNLPITSAPLVPLPSSLPSPSTTEKARGKRRRRIQTQPSAGSLPKAPSLHSIFWQLNPARFGFAGRRSKRCKVLLFPGRNSQLHAQPRYLGCIRALVLLKVCLATILGTRLSRWQQAR